MHAHDSREPEVRGIVLTAIREFIQSKLSLAEMDLFVKPLPFDVSYALSNAEKGEWYPYSIQQRLHEAISFRFNRDDPSKAIYEMGLFVADYEINAVLKAMFSFFPLKLIFTRVQTIWSKFYRSGNVTASLIHEGKAAFELRNFDTDLLFCALVESWMEVAGKYLKLNEFSVKQTVAIHKGSNLCRWEMEWK